LGKKAEVAIEPVPVFSISPTGFVAGTGRQINQARIFLWRCMAFSLELFRFGLGIDLVLGSPLQLFIHAKQGAVVMNRQAVGCTAIKRD
jgi:hypothetical protein